jgi:hypothetical protein
MHSSRVSGIFSSGEWLTLHKDGLKKAQKAKGFKVLPKKIDDGNKISNTEPAASKKAKLQKSG